MNGLESSAYFLQRMALWLITIYCAVAAAEVYVVLHPDLAQFNPLLAIVGALSISAVFMSRAIVVHRLWWGATVVGVFLLQATLVAIDPRLTNEWTRLSFLAVVVVYAVVGWILFFTRSEAPEPKGGHRVPRMDHDDGTSA